MKRARIMGIIDLIKNFRMLKRNMIFQSASFSKLFRLNSLLILLRIFVSGVFVYAGASKLMDLRAFALIIEEFGVVPLTVLPFVAVGLPVFEVIAGAGLAFNVRGSLVAITLMTVMFLGVLGYAIAEGLVIADCGCFAPGELPAGYDDGSALKDAFARDVGLLLACAVLFLPSCREKQFASEKIV